MASSEQVMPPADSTAESDSTIYISPDATDKIALHIECPVPSSPPETRTSTLIVSKAVLMDASPVFNRMLTNNARQKAQSPSATGSDHLTIDGTLYGETAFIDMMYILHGETIAPDRYDRLSKFIDLATVLDYSGCGWDRVPDMETSIALALRKDPYWVNLDTAMEWAWVAWFFWDTDVFEQVTAYVIGHSEDRISARPLRLPEYVCALMNECRERSIRDLLKPLRGYIEAALRHDCPLLHDSAWRDRLILSPTVIDADPTSDTYRGSDRCMHVIKATIPKLHQDGESLYSLPERPYAGCSFRQLSPALSRDVPKELEWDLMSYEPYWQCLGPLRTLLLGLRSDERKMKRLTINDVGIVIIAPVIEACPYRSCWNLDSTLGSCDCRY
ncbi:hypothetical protein ASPACDRAFT_1858241 [Aspergillus aculeatus ATCC 16872]|uniref:BTB domain-containing protein n=1 Tax=Aspergillus aculeatus (strain ATCC 16872 / CBS 172.66 / WB 5094) TaxID=690307 RepID=A0A1L9WMR1_ASPA1|nr:uncharacterized protein ASPACDRAFT_1858241 [Aspergillus aculeatus ATCC 16872]OJJ97459.1 hypothetical protein ASPACDRAFT_1858241 [Aspergillus aculeatus ATCC 16872]